jgi:hypothetical protein
MSSQAWNSVLDLELDRCVVKGNRCERTESRPQPSKHGAKQGKGNRQVLSLLDDGELLIRSVYASERSWRRPLRWLLLRLHGHIAICQQS